MRRAERCSAAIISPAFLREPRFERVCDRACGETALSGLCMVGDRMRNDRRYTAKLLHADRPDPVLWLWRIQAAWGSKDKQLTGEG